MLPLYFGALGIFSAIPAMPGVLLALPSIVFGEMKGIRGAAYYVLTGGVAAAVGRAVAAYVLGYGALLEGAGLMLIVPALYGAITGAIYWRFVGRSAGIRPQQAPDPGRR